jgi:hypothetical protein
MEGGAIIGEGAEGCVYAQPLWPCAADRPKDGNITQGSDPSVVSKLVDKGDFEHVYLEAARDILGQELSLKFLAGIRGMCSPANDRHPPPQDHIGDYKQSKDALMKWESTGLACGKMKSALTKTGITDKYNLMFISRYPSTLEQWMETMEQKKIPRPFIIKAINDAIPPLLNVLQKFYHHPTLELINMDLHHKNIFIRATGSKLQFGISDFGQCYFRRLNDPNTSGPYFSYYLERFYTVRVPMYFGFRQIPFETRLIDFCFKNKLENHDPGQLINAFVNDPKVKEYQANSNDIIAMNLDLYCAFLIKKPLFIQAVEMIQSITKKIRKLQAGVPPQSNIVSMDEFTFLEFCMTRFLAVSPLVTILEQTLFLSEGLYTQVKQISTDRIAGIGTAGLTKKPEIYYLTEYINRIILAPYSGSIQGSSLVSSLESVKAVDLTMVWADILAGK